MEAKKHLRILVLGKGAREHALAWKLSQSPTVECVLVAPGNGGTAHGLPNVTNVEGVNLDDYDQLVVLAQKHKINLVVVGPDSLVVGGIQQYFRQAQIPCFAPSQAAAEVEGSKVFAKEFMQKHNIPTAEYRTFDASTYQAATEYVNSVSHRIVIKADGLAAGKGVVLPATTAEALQVLDDMINKKRFGAAGQTIVIEEFLDGPEISVHTLSDGFAHVSLSIGQDHKRIHNGNSGPNTGGMGVYAPVPFVDRNLEKQIDEVILKPTLEGLREDGRTFSGLLFTGIILTKTGPKVLEYNARFGDPETQSLLPLLGEGVDFAEVLLACTNGRLHQVDIQLSEKSVACGVVLAAEGYPDVPKEGDRITIGELPQDCVIFHAGTKIANDELLTAGGRVLTVVGLGKSPTEAITTAYEGVKSVKFRGMQYRTDIGQQCLETKAL